MTPFVAFERLFFAVFGQTTNDDINPMPDLRPAWTEGFFKIIFGTYLLVSVIVLINLLIAMMSDTYQRIQVNYSNQYLCEHSYCSFCFFSSASFILLPVCLVFYVISLSSCLPSWFPICLFSITHVQFSVSLFRLELMYFSFANVHVLCARCFRNVHFYSTLALCL